MKIIDVQVEVLKVTLEREYSAGGRKVDGNWHVLARVTTSDGTEGFGYVVKQREDLVRAIAVATKELGKHLIGMDVMKVEAACPHPQEFGCGSLQYYIVHSMQHANTACSVQDTVYGI